MQKRESESTRQHVPSALNRLESGRGVRLNEVDSSTAPKLHQIPLAIDENHLQAERLEKIISELESRLTPVLRNPDDASCLATAAPVLVGLADVLQQNAVYVASSVNRLSSILERLEL